MSDTTFTMRVKIWRYPGKAGWCFVTVPKTTSAKITKRFGAWKRGWGSLPVKVTFGTTSWKTSIFPDRKAATYLLPIKSEIRKKKAIEEGQTIEIDVQINVRHAAYGE